MDTSEKEPDSSSSKTILLWKNEKSQHENDVNACLSSHCVWKPHDRNKYKAPRGLSEYYLYLIRKTANDLINRVIADSLRAIESTEPIASCR